MATKKFNLENKVGLFGVVLLLTALTKVLEWLAQAFLLNNISSNFVSFYGNNFVSIMVLQMAFILSITFGLYHAYNYSGAKKSQYLYIPALSYLIKEIYNFMFIYEFQINNITFIALFLEPLILFFITKWIWKKIVK